MTELMELPAIAECSVAGCSYNDHSHCHAAAITVGGTGGDAQCATFIPLTVKGGLDKVLSHVGSFTNIRGGDILPGRIRKTAKKPIRVFLQDGSNDLDNEHGNWPLGNQQMALSLKFKGYDYRFEYGEGGHNGKHGGAILPDSLRWLWRPAAAAVEKK